MSEYENGQTDVRGIVRALYEVMGSEWCVDGVDPETLVASWIRHRKHVTLEGHTLIKVKV